MLAFYLPEHISNFVAFQRNLLSLREATVSEDLSDEVLDGTIEDTPAISACPIRVQHLLHTSSTTDLARMRSKTMLRSIKNAFQ